MTYRRVLLGRWSRRDWLAVVVIAVAVAFLVGTVLVVTAMETQTTTIAGEYATGGTVTTHDSLAEATAAAGVNATVIPFSIVTGPDGERQYVLGRPDVTGSISVLGDGSGNTVGTLETATHHQLHGPKSTQTLTVTPRPTNKHIPATWYITAPETVSQLGVSGAFVVHPTQAETIPDVGVPLRTVLAFFVFGSREALSTLWAVAGGSAVLIAVVVYSVTRMTVRDRRDTIRVVRATGGTAHTVLGIFGLRASILSTVGIAMGYAIGIIAVNAALNVAVFLGLPTALPITVTPRVASILAPLCLTILLIGSISGILATWLTVRRPPIRSGDHGGDAGLVTRIPSKLQPTLLGWRALIPTAATLSAFVAFVVLVAAIGGVIAPLTAADTATITESDAAHPFASTVPATAAGALRNHGINASAEILVLQTRDGQPYVTRGVNYSAFTSVTQTVLVSGRTPRNADEAVIGADLATTLGVSPGDTLTLGGLTRPKLTRVTVVGTFQAPGPADDQLLVSLDTARHLSGKQPGVVQFIRADRLPAQSTIRPKTGIHVVSVTAPRQTPPNSSFNAQITVRNRHSTAVTKRFSVSFANETVTRTVSVAGGETTTLTIPFTAGHPGTYTVTAGQVTQSVTVVSPNALRVDTLPKRAPPNTSLHVRVRTPSGEPVPNATVTVGTQTRQTNVNGSTQIRFGDVGQHTITARKDGYTAQETVTVQAGASRQLRPNIRINPSTPTLLTTPTVRIELRNPWGEPLTRTVTLTGPGADVQRQVHLTAGGTRTLTVSLPRRPPGTYAVTVSTNTSARAQTTYRVTGDERVATVIASGGQTGSSGIGQAIETAFGNLQFVLAVVLGLAAAMTIGGTTATFTQAIHARRQTIGIYRATGAGPRRICRIVLADALRIGAVATLLGIVGGLAALHVLRATGYLTIFGVRLSPAPSLSLLGWLIGGALGITLVSAGLATVGLLVTAPYRLLTTTKTPPPTPEDSHDNT